MCWVPNFVSRWSLEKSVVQYRITLLVIFIIINKRNTTKHCHKTHRNPPSLPPQCCLLKNCRFCQPFCGFGYNKCGWRDTSLPVWSRFLHFEHTACNLMGIIHMWASRRVRGVGGFELYMWLCNVYLFNKEKGPSIARQQERFTLYHPLRARHPTLHSGHRLFLVVFAHVTAVVITLVFARQLDILRNRNWL